MSKEYITLSEDFFEHLLNCMCNIEAVMQMDGEMKRDGKRAIDKAYSDARELLHGKKPTNIKVFKT